MKAQIVKAIVAVALSTLLSACGSEAPPEPLRYVRTAEVRYDKAGEAHRYFGAVHARYEVDQAFRVGGKVIARKVDVGQKVSKGDVLAVLDDVDYKLAEEAARQQLEASRAQARQAESDAKRLAELKLDGSVSDSDEEHAQSNLSTTRAAAEADARKLALARNQVQYTVLRASISGVVTGVRFEVGQVVAAGQPVVAVADQGEPEIVADIPEDHLEAFTTARYRATLASAPQEQFAVVLRELSAQASPQTRTYRARLKPVKARHLPLGATATLIAESATKGPQAAAIPASALTQKDGKPALWVARHSEAEGEAQGVATVHLVGVEVHGYRNEEVLVSGPAQGELVVTAGVHKMAPGLRVALPNAALSSVTVKADAQ